MSVTEIMLIIAGVTVFALGYLMPTRKKDMGEEIQLISEEEVRKMVDREVESAKGHISNIVGETVTYAMEKTERSMERVTNEKMMAVNEYSDTVLEEINKNHKEVLFLYDMLNDKHENLTRTVSEAAKTAEEVKQTVKDAEISARETKTAVENMELTARETKTAVENMEITAREAQEAAENAVNAMMEKAQEYDREVERRAVSTVSTVETYEVYEEPETAVNDKITEIALYKGSDDMIYEEMSAYRGLEKEEYDRTQEISAYDDGQDDIYEVMDFRETPIDAVLQTENDKQPVAEEEDNFIPISPPRVAIIHNPDADYVAEPNQLLEALALSVAEKPAAEMKSFQAETKSSHSQYDNGKGNRRNNNERILELHNAGKSNVAIAKELGLGVGEVKLVIDLFVSP